MRRRHGVAPVPGIPARNVGSKRDGRSPGSQISAFRLPSRALRHSGTTSFRCPGTKGNPLTVAGAATVLAPPGVFRTVFPINPLHLMVGEPSTRT